MFGPIKKGWQRIQEAFGGTRPEAERPPELNTDEIDELFGDDAQAPPEEPSPWPRPPEPPQPPPPQLESPPPPEPKERVRPARPPELSFDAEDVRPPPRPEDEIGLDLPGLPELEEEAEDDIYQQRRESRRRRKTRHRPGAAPRPEPETAEDIAAEIGEAPMGEAPVGERPAERGGEQGGMGELVQALQANTQAIQELTTALQQQQEQGGGGGRDYDPYPSTRGPY